MKKFIVSVLSLLMLITLCACGESNTTTGDNTNTPDYTLVKDGVLTVSMSTDYAPFEFIDLTKQGQDMFVGADVEVAKVIANYLGLELEIKSMDFDAAMVALDNGLVDLCIEGISWSPTREAAYAFSAAYTNEEDAFQAMVVKKGDAAKFATLDDINQPEVKMGVQKGTVQQELAQDQTPNATLNIIAKYDDAWTMLKSGALDVVVCDSKVYNALCEKEPGVYELAQDTFVWTMKGKYALAKKGNDAFVAAVSEAISKCVSQETFEQWIDDASALYTQLGDNASESVVSEEE